MKKLVAPLVLLPILASCGLQPLYIGGSNSAAATSLSSIAVDPIEGKVGWLVRNALTDRLGVAGNNGGQSRYRLLIQLEDNIEGLGIRPNDTVTREKRTLRARYKLVDQASGVIVLDATAGSDAGIDVVSSDYGTIAAENTALENLSKAISDQIIVRLSLFAQQQGTAPVAPQ